MKSVEDKLNETFGLEGTDMVPSSRHTRGVPAKIEVKSNPDERKTDSDNDYSLVRETLHNTINRANDSLEGAIEVAKETGKAREYEVVGQLIKTISDVAGDLISLQDKMNKIQDDKPSTVNNNLNVTLTTTELNKMLKSGD
jgi:hypothetical protein